MAPGVVGRLSVNATLLRMSWGFGFTSVNVRLVVPPARIGSVMNSLLITGGCSAVRVAVADPPEPELVPVSVEAIYPLTLVCGPLVVAAMLTLTVQALLA